MKTLVGSPEPEPIDSEAQYRLRYKKVMQDVRNVIENARRLR